MAEFDLYKNTEPIGAVADVLPVLPDEPLRKRSERLPGRCAQAHSRIKEIVMYISLKALKRILRVVEQREGTLGGGQGLAPAII